MKKGEKGKRKDLSMTTNNPYSLDGASAPFATTCIIYLQVFKILSLWIGGWPDIIINYLSQESLFQPAM